MAAPTIYMEPLDGSEMIRVLKNGRLYLAPVTAVLDLRTSLALSVLTHRLDTLEAALAAEGRARTAADATAADALAAETAARQGIDTDQGTRIAALEGRPEEAAHFTASAKLPAITVLQPVTLSLTGLTPARAGDVLRKGEAVTVTPASALPAGVNIAAAFVPADGTVAVQLTTGISIALGTVPIAWSITVHR